MENESIKPKSDSEVAKIQEVSVEARHTWILPLVVSIAALFLVGLLFYVFFIDTKLLKELADPAIARGLITFLFAIGTIVLATIITLGVLLGKAAHLKERFDRGKEILGLLLGILGTIIGYYFGITETNKQTEEDSSEQSSIQSIHQYYS